MVIDFFGGYKMKKILALLLAMFMIAALVACSNKGNTEDNALETLGLNDNSFTNNNIGTFTYEVSADGHYEITKYIVNTSVEHEVVIPETIQDVDVTSIAADAFKSCTSVTAITIPETVKYIGDFAFYDCDKLTKITLPNSVIEIGTGAFRGCDLLNNVTLPSSLAEIADQLFWECPSLSNITFGNAVTVIGEGAFFNCDALTSMVIPETVKEIKASAFYDCDSLVSITVPKTVATIGDAAFADITAEKVTFNAKTGSYFETYFADIYGINDKEYAHYEIKVD